ncbi:MAG: hypothetical protein ACKVHP_02905, partial [Verrucomicrobiales bacterium]
LYNNLQAAPSSSADEAIVAEQPSRYGAQAEILALVIEIDKTVKRVRPDGFRGVQAKENVIKAALLPLLDNDIAEVERIFAIIEQHPDY